MLAVKRFSGILNTDDQNSDILPNQHTHGRNIRFTGGAVGLTAENVKGTVLVNNGDLPNGTNECLGAFFDSVRQRILWFNWNQYGNNGIYSYSVQTGVVTQIFRCGVNSATDILNFSLDYPVHSAAIVYRTTGDGDLLYWTDGYNRPKYINLDTVATMSPFTADMLYAAKNAPLAPPDCAYANDVTVNTNNLRKKLFRACYRWVYKNGDKSTFSPISKVPLPSNGYNPDDTTDPTNNNNIEITVDAGGADFQAIEIAGQFNINNAWSDFFLIDKLDRDDYNIPVDGTYTYDFYNDGAYSTIDPQETDLYFSWLPDKANTLELLNGNVLVYGGITDGYDKLAREDVNVTVQAALTNPNIPTISFAYAGANVFTFLIGTVIQNGAVYQVQFTYNSTLGGDASPKNAIYTTTPGNTQDNIASGLAALLTGNNITATYLGAGLVRVFVTGYPVGSTITNVSVNVSVAGSEIAAASWKWNQPQRFGLVYFDDRGKTNGVISFVSDSALDTTDFAVNTPAFGTSSNVIQVPAITASIDHTPPTWATSYQWVRADLRPKFLYWVTNDYQSNADYLYFCIQNLDYQKSKSNGFVPSYEFASGDRVRVIAAYTGGNFSAYNDQLDFEILGEEELTMSSPAENGRFLKVARPTTFPSYQAAMLIEIYTPQPRVNDQAQLFYEWGEKYDIYESGGSRYHRGQLSDQTGSQPATFEWFDGDCYYRPREFYEAVNGVTSVSEFFMDANYSDYFESAVNSNGRGWVIDENAKEEYNPVLVRWGGKYQAGTNINQLNIFRPSDFDEVDRGKGDIRRFKVRDRIMRVFQDRGVGQYGIYARFIQNNEGVSDLVTTNEIITTNNIQYYQGVFGLSGYPTNLCSSPIADYFTDVITGRGIRLAADGLTDLGVLYKGQFYFPRLVTPYNKTLTRSNGSKAKVMAFFDTFDNDFHTILQPGTGGGVTSDGYHFAFNEPRNGYVCDQYDYNPDFALSANDTIFSWQNGFFYKHTNETNPVTFYGVKYPVEITLVFNDNLLEKKSWQAISQAANTIWAAPLMYTNVMSYGTQRQETNLVEAEFTLLEGMPSSAIKRDANSRGGKVNGNFMKGNYLSVKLQKANATNYVTLNEVALKFSDSPKTDR